MLALDSFSSLVRGGQPSNDNASKDKTNGDNVTIRSEEKPEHGTSKAYTVSRSVGSQKRLKIHWWDLKVSRLDWYTSFKSDRIIGR